MAACHENYVRISGPQLLFQYGRSVVQFFSHVLLDWRTVVAGSSRFPHK